MSNAPSYNMGLYGGIDYNSLMNNPYLYYAMMSPNINFKGNTESSEKTDASASVSNTNTQQNLTNSVIDTSQAQSSEGSSFAQSALALTMIGAGAYALFRGHKSGYLEKAWKKITGKTDNKTVNTVLQKMTAVKNGNGEMKIQVPNKTKTFAGTKIETGVQGYGVQSAISNARQSFNPQTSVIKSFHITTPEDIYTVFIEDGQITKVVSALMKKDEDVLSRLANAETGSTDAELLSRFKKIVTELGKETKEADKAVLKDVVNIRYSNKYGDDTLNMVMEKYGETPTLQSFKTLEQFDRTSEAVKSYVPSASEEVFAGEIVNKKGNVFNKKGVLVDGLEVLKCDKEIVSGTRCFFEGKNLVRIEENGVVYPIDSFRFKEFIKENEKAINEFKKGVFEDRIASKIPQGAVIGTV